ncbi:MULTISPECIES: DUF1295 domain-containing protein [Mycobacterium]|uniref:DUF1295 domain-containing protein n=1 Tax=Mycobacterium kiyosense TaxID=2871094 RepID=A0A9P3UUQ7_9MYCO|nr:MULTISPECIES: DUF1295 domain-containing protein [Mycobacterium]BDB43859.1 hypothetical protein IWGMT90018_43050 [Mycobacterium kiyosense]BDE15415.1 hypothetical protein MKCMC460_42750 [Mycobacterium sp. 20KCMC460]GLB82697.1 hypothetical protein SRL2020028_19530 [Mycobacterium kiyosense]GLB90160.1 hypothetical protein SRL2020130_29770 [Mycobacterium kiyosense]GLB95749.1 hypothetical protein SRL2020226_25250 [Mycobacterium kiyosense]
MLNLTTAEVEVFLLASGVTIAIVTAIWVLGLIRGEHSVMDGWYGFGFVLPAAICFWSSGGAHSQTAALLLLMVALHGCRLGWYLGSRWRRFVTTHGGDPRYLQWRKDYADGYWWKSFFRVMEPQALVIILVGLPSTAGILGNREINGQIGILTAVGLAVFGIGYYFETVADGQLQSFLALSTRPRYLNTGVWTYSRHPNYFGNTLVWWGIWIVAVAGNPDIWWTVAGPAVNTLMLTKVLGSAYQDKVMGDRPEYQALMARTRAFLPLPIAR